MRVCLVALLILGVAGVPGISYSAVVHGTADLYPWYMPGCACGWDQAFDFSTQAIVPRTSGVANLAFEFMPQNGSPVWSLLHATSFFYLTDAIEAVQTVPETGYSDGHIHPTGTYVLKTDENFYVKLTVRGSNGDDVIFEYYLQDDGTRNFGPALPTEQSTWGRVKALYR